MKKYLQDYNAILDRELRKIRESGLLKADKETIFEYYQYCVSNELSVPRMARTVSILRFVFESIQKPILKASRKDMENYVFKMRQDEKTDSTIDTYKATLKVFYKWVNGGELYPDCVKWMKRSNSKGTKLPEEMLTPEDIKALMSQLTHPRDKAFIASLWESGARIGELGTMEIRHVAFDDFGCQAMLNGKTGQRRIRLVSSAPYLLEWINQHPKHANSNAPLWINIHQNTDNPMHHRFIGKMLSTLARKARITKPINPHSFRHSRATYMAQFLTEAQMKEYFGWSQDSNMAARYVHLSGKQVDDAILKMYGLKKEDEKKDVLKQEPCPRCKTTNDVNNQYCTKCWLPLTPQAVTTVAETQQKDQDAMLAVMKILDLAKNNPKFLQEIMLKAKNGGDH